jgi:hypothetical protein
MTGSRTTTTIHVIYHFKAAFLSTPLVVGATEAMGRLLGGKGEGLLRYQYQMVAD